MAAVLDEQGLSYEVERKQVRKHGEERIFVHIHVNDRFPFELTIYASDKAHYVFKSSITGKAIERASIAELEQLLAREYPDVSLDQSVLEAESRVDRFQIYEILLLPLENVKESPKYHPEGDALYHSLQVFDLARNELPYDEEFLLAALLHDVGKAIDRQDHVAAGLEALAEHITPRTAWFIAHHMEGQELLDGTLGRPRPAAAGSVGRFRRVEAPGPLRSQWPAARRRDLGPGRGDRVSSRAGGNLRGVSVSIEITGLGISPCGGRTNVSSVIQPNHPFGDFLSGTCRPHRNDPGNRRNRPRKFSAGWKPRPPMDRIIIGNVVSLVDNTIFW